MCTVHADANEQSLSTCGRVSSSSVQITWNVVSLMCQSLPQSTRSVHSSAIPGSSLEVDASLKMQQTAR